MAKKQQPKRTIIPTSGAQAFEHLRDEIAAVPEDQLIQISADISVAHEIARAAADRIDDLMPELVKLSGLDLHRIRKLRVYAAACEHSHVLAASPDEDDVRLRRLLDEAVKLRRTLLSTASLLVVVGELSEDRVAAIPSGIGHVETARAIEMLGVLFEQIWDRVESRIPVTAEMVERAPVLAYELHGLLGANRVEPIAKASDAQRMQQRAFTLLVQVYDECRSAVAYLRRREGDAELYAPSLFVKKRRRPTAPEIEPPETEESETTPTVPSTTVRPQTPIRLPITELEPTG
ncbi:MAG TPA: hypothetical protein VG755_28070 [Nannocystaceae bacterium]|nr:hypothetical protein [Nannocystaceae bacterium]